MTISLLELTKFRNLPQNTFQFSLQTTLIVGPNGTGKTNILEAIYLLATGHSWRTTSSKEMIAFTSPAAHIKGIVGPDEIKLRVTLSRGLIQGKRVPKAIYQIDGVSRYKANFAHQLKVVLFEPESLQIIIGDPSHRRNLLNEIITQVDSEYDRSLKIYDKALRSRNRLLDRIHDGREKKEILEYWERALLKHGSRIQTARRRLIDWFNTNAGSDSTGNGQLKSLVFCYTPNVINQARLDQYRSREIFAGHTFVGPQRDDVEILFSPQRSFSAFGSRGDQRMAVLKIKLLQAQYLENQTGQKPIILLDDIFSELDAKHEAMIGALVNTRQTIITATEIHQGHYPKGKIISL